MQSILISPMKIIFSTHGETLQNIDDIIQGQTDGDLSVNGRRQIASLADNLKDEKLDYIYTSSLRRCIETAKEVAKYHPNAVYKEDDRLRARKLGILEGKKRSETEWNKLSGDYYTKKPQEGESLLEYWNRVADFYKEICKLTDDPSILVVAHGETKVILEGLIRELPITKTFQGHDCTKNLPIISQPAKGDIVIYEFPNCPTLNDEF